MQRRIRIIIHLIDDVIMSARDELSHHRRSQHLFNLESLSLIYERRNCNGANVSGMVMACPAV